MTNAPFYDEFTLTQTAAKFGKKAMDLGLIPSFFVRYFPDSQQFYIPDESQANPLTPEEAYLHLKQLVEQSNHS